MAQDRPGGHGRPTSPAGTSQPQKATRTAGAAPGHHRRHRQQLPARGGQMRPHPGQSTGRGSPEALKAPGSRQAAFQEGPRMPQERGGHVWTWAEGRRGRRKDALRRRKAGMTSLRPAAAQPEKLRQLRRHSGGARRHPAPERPKATIRASYNRRYPKRCPRSAPVVILSRPAARARSDPLPQPGWGPPPPFRHYQVSPQTFYNFFLPTPLDICLHAC